MQPSGDARPRKPVRPSRRAPFLRLLLFYAVIAGIAITAVQFVPFIREAWTGEIRATQQATELIRGGTTGIAPAPPDQRTLDRVIIVVLITLSSLALSLPVAWVYAFTRRLRYDPSLVHSVIILPMVVAGIVLIVKDSVALAFSLAGIVAAVRFRNTLKDPKDAVYIFLALGIGLACGVQAVDVAFVSSLLFNVVVLVLWKWNLGAIYSGEHTRDLLAVGNTQYMIARHGAQRDAIRWRLSRENEGMDTDGILLVHTEDPETARQAVELSLSKTAEAYRMVESFRRRGNVETFAVLLELDEKKGDPLAILADLDERWQGEVLAAEYVPFKRAAAEKDADHAKS
ncbi:MAG TPA: DUF4956 domain-containing protein [Steroidobacteraceae bacterium]